MKRLTGRHSTMVRGPDTHHSRSSFGNRVERWFHDAQGNHEGVRVFGVEAEEGVVALAGYRVS